MKLNNVPSSSGGGGNGKAPPAAARGMYGLIHGVHSQLVEAKRAAKHQIQIPGRPPSGLAIKPELVLHLEDAVFFLAGQCLALNAAVTQLQERFDERSGDGNDGAAPIIVEAGEGSGGSGGG